MDYNMIGTAWSLLSPIVAIALALKTKEVYSSLFIGIIFRSRIILHIYGYGLRRIFSSISPTIPS